MSIYIYICIHTYKCMRIMRTWSLEPRRPSREPGGTGLHYYYTITITITIYYSAYVYISYYYYY